MYDEIFNNGSRCTLQGAGDPNTNGVTLPTGCTAGVYLNDEYDSRNPSTTVFVWDGVAPWVARA